MNPASNCLADDTLLSFAFGKLSARETSEVDRHLNDCRTCITIIAELARYLCEEEPATGDPRPRPGQPPLRGAQP